MKWNYSLLTEGEHIVTVLVIDEEGTRQSKDVVFKTTGFKSEFIANPQDVQTDGAVLTILEDGRIVIAGAVVEGELVDIELLWDTASQQFQINKIVREEPEKENQAPTADAGSNLTVQTGEAVEISGGASDSDGTVESWNWVRVSGLQVSLQNANTSTVSFIAPDDAGTINRRLTVTGNDGDSEYPAQPAFIWNSALADSARLHSMDMAREGYFAHTSLDGTSMGDRVFPYWSGNRVGENIAASSIDRSNSYVVNLWLDSPGHCVLIMDPDFTHVGIGAGHNSENGYSMHHFWTLDFGG